MFLERIRVVACLSVLVVASGSAAGCAPPELLEAASDTGLSEVDGASEDVGEQVAFGEVADIVRNSCATNSSCHGEGGSTRFTVEGSLTATDEQVQAALEVEDAQLVVPGNADDSLIYQRIVTSGVARMPPTGRLDDEQIETVRVWIDQGAQYE